MLIQRPDFSKPKPKASTLGTKVALQTKKKHIRKNHFFYGFKYVSSRSRRLLAAQLVYTANSITASASNGAAQAMRCEGQQSPCGVAFEGQKHHSMCAPARSP